jgi:hypothetical protein
MKSPQEVAKVLGEFDASESNFQGMTYEQGVEEALMWVMEEIPDEDFSPAAK